MRTCAGLARKALAATTHGPTGPTSSRIHSSGSTPSSALSPPPRESSPCCSRGSWGPWSRPPCCLGGGGARPARGRPPASPPGGGGGSGRGAGGGGALRAFAPVVAVAFVLGVFLVTPFELEWHLRTALDRVLVHASLLFVCLALHATASE